MTTPSPSRAVSCPLARLHASEPPRVGVHAGEVGRLGVAGSEASTPAIFQTNLKDGSGFVDNGEKGST